jgi:UDP-N-acetylglucosamine 2-epimerase
MSPYKVAIVVGTRPELIKIQPIINQVLATDLLELIFIHTGQHYDWNMSKIFLEELGLPEPHFFLKVKASSQGAQTARIIARCEKVFKKVKPDIVLVLGDTNSALGAALAATKLNIPVGHIEAGCRSFEKYMSEEINRVLIADLADLNFAPTQTCVQNLINEGIPMERIHLVGHPIVDILHNFEKKINVERLFKFGVEMHKYYFVTLHRRENIEDKKRLTEILQAFKDILGLNKSYKIIFPVHPHTKKMIKKFSLHEHVKDIMLTEPLGYSDTLTLIKFAKAVLTDSGGVQQEAALLGTPCITLRRKTEWIETIESNVNFLAYTPEQILNTLKKIEEEYCKIAKNFIAAQQIFGSPPVSKKIIDIVLCYLMENTLK